MKKNKKNSFIGSIVSLLASQVFVKIFGLMYKLYLTNRDGFGDSGNAIYSSGFQIYALLLTFSSTGIPNAISKLVAERLAVGDSRGANRIFKIAFVIFSIIGILGSLLLFLGAEIIANVWIQIPEAKNCLIALSPSIFFVTINAVIKGYFNGRQDFSLTAKSQSLEQIFKTIFTFLLVEIVAYVVKENTALMAASANLATTFATISSFIYIYRYYNLQKKEIKKEITHSVNYTPTRIRKTLKKILKVSIPISFSSFISSFNKNIDSFTVVRFLKKFLTDEDAKTQYGILSGKIDSLCALPLSINSAFVVVLVPNISKLMACQKIEKVIKLIKKFIFISMLIAIPTTILMFAFPEQILKILFPNACSGANYLKLSSISIIFMILSQTENGILQGIGKNNIPVISFGIGILFKIFCNIVLIQNVNIGIFGAILGNIICNFIACIIETVVLIKEFRKLKKQQKGMIA